MSVRCSELRGYTDAVTSRKKRGSYAKTPEQRRHILDVAIDVFGRLGNRGASLREIANRAGMSQAGVLHHFGSKDGLLMAVLADRDDEHGRIDSVAGGVAELRSLLLQAQNNPGLTQLFTTIAAEATDPDHPAHAFMVERYRRTVSTFTAAVDAGKRDGDLDEHVNSEALARLMIAAMDGLQTQGLIEGDDVDVLASFDVLVESLTTALVRR
ncbi:MAG: TetR/AcrR family transcriptional regulator [Rhodococcus sp.]|nr:TetR/AcrR family transcriptional regulator [Rhodococcus sp. (in: high G+C Gram-positive bacteria)]